MNTRFAALWWAGAVAALAAGAAAQVDAPYGYAVSAMPSAPPAYETAQSHPPVSALPVYAATQGYPDAPAQQVYETMLDRQPAVSTLPGYEMTQDRETVVSSPPGYEMTQDQPA
ncbi:hypothetical protein H4R21_005284, partial [Coemansia helicoidea]